MVEFLKYGKSKLEIAAADAKVREIVPAVIKDIELNGDSSVQRASVQKNLTTDHLYFV